MGIGFVFRRREDGGEGLSVGGLDCAEEEEGVGGGGDDGVEVRDFERHGDLVR